MLAVALSLAALAAPTAPIESSRLVSCTPPAAMAAKDVDHPRKPKRLGDLPPARHDLAVLRAIGGCWVASVVRYDPVTHERTVTYEPEGTVRPQEVKGRLKLPGL